jgi:NTE family protein
MMDNHLRGILLSGGGARAAYQGGVLRAILELSREHGRKVPFEILVGVSAGAINLAALARHAGDFGAAVDEMTRRWETIETAKIFKTNFGAVFTNAVRWFLDLALGGIFKHNEPRGKALVDTDPLRRLVNELLPPGCIDEHLRTGVIAGVAVSAMNFSSGELTVFIEASAERTLWRRATRTSEHARITPMHILASCALPVLFPAVRIGSAFFGDGSIHNMAPISPAIHLGARKVLAIGVREPAPSRERKPPAEGDERYPSPAKITGVLLDSIFMDSLEADREQMERINELLPQAAAHKDRQPQRMRRIDFLYLGPSRNLAEVALEHRHELPKSIRYMLRGLGARGGSGGELISYLLFEPGYCRALLDLGYRDTLARAREVENFLWTHALER